MHRYSLKHLLHVDLHEACRELVTAYRKTFDDFKNGNHSVVSFTYNGIKETLSYIPVNGTDWFLTYLIRESVITENISTISEGIITRSLTQSVIAALFLIAIFTFILLQQKKNTKLLIEKKAADVEQHELEHRLELQEKLLEEEKQRTQQTRLITALSSDYWSV